MDTDIKMLLSKLSLFVFKVSFQQMNEISIVEAQEVGMSFSK
jgi:hypothetical protein